MDWNLWIISVRFKFLAISAQRNACKARRHIIFSVYPPHDSYQYHIAEKVLSGSERVDGVILSSVGSESFFFIILDLVVVARGLTFDVWFGGFCFRGR